MNIKGLDYNTEREHLVLPEYGREIQQMVDHAVALPDRSERQRCANTIIAIMDRMCPEGRNAINHKAKLWDHLALMSGFQLDIDYPCDVSQAAQIARRPDPLAYPANKIPVRHYGAMLFELFDQLKTMEPGKKRDELVKLVANQMRRDLIQWSHGSCDNEKVASDLARFTDGKIQLDLSTFVFEKKMPQEPGGKGNNNNNNNNRKRK